MASKVLQYFVVLFLLGTIAQSSYLLYKLDTVIPHISDDYRYTGGASSGGNISFCVNTPPTIGIPCNATVDQGSLFSCQLNASDPNSGSSFTFSSEFITSPELFNVTSGGLAQFTPNSSHVANHTVNFSVVDNSGCVNNLDYQTFTFEVSNINDPPYLRVAIDNVSLSANETVRAFFLDNHFADPDGDVLTYNVSGADEANITINNQTSEVIINSNTCDFNDVVIFTAKDPYNLTAQSNQVTIRCQVEEEQQSTPTGGGGGGGGGSGGICRSNFECREHIPCNEDNIKVMKCSDLNGCEDEELIKLACNYEQSVRERCTEDWVCEDWSACTINGTQSRECRDVNNCKTELDKPETTRECEYTPTCNDGVRNGNETGIDCGGNCPACRQIEVPGTPPEQGAGWLTQLLAIILAILILISLVYKYEHKNLYMLLSKLGFQFAGRVEKQIILDEKHRDELLEKLKEVESEYSSKTTAELKPELIDIMKSYFFHALDLEVDAGKEDLLAKVEEGKINEHLYKVLASFFDKTMNLEFSTDPLNGYEVMFLVEEIREMVLETSGYDHDVIEAKTTEYRIGEDLFPVEKAYLMLVNAYIPLHFNELETSIEKYMGILDFYETLSEQQKDDIYEDITRLYQKIRYRSAWIQNM